MKRPRVDPRALERWMKMTFEEIEREINSTQFQNMRIARASMKISGALVESAPTIKRVLMDFASRLEGSKQVCEACSKEYQENVVDMKDKKSYLDMLSTVMDRFGITKIDVSQADILNDVDTEEAIKEGMKICEELYGEKPVVQRFLKALVEPGVLNAGEGTLHEVGVNLTALAADKTDGPVPTVLPVRVHETPALLEPPVSGGDNVEPVIQD